MFSFPKKIKNVKNDHKIFKTVKFKFACIKKQKRINFGSLLILRIIIENISERIFKKIISLIKYKLKMSESIRILRNTD